jgi:hypothetical protein
VKPAAWVVIIATLGAGAGALAWNKHRIVQDDEAKQALDAACARAYGKIAELVEADAGPFPEPTYLTGKVLPVTSIGLEMGRDGWLYPLLPDAIRAHDDADAGTVAVVVTNYSRVYMSTGGAGGSTGFGVHGAISDVTVTLVDLPHHAVLGQKRFRQDPPPARATEAELDAYTDGFWAPVASFLAGLPRR